MDYVQYLRYLYIWIIKFCNKCYDTDICYRINCTFNDRCFSIIIQMLYECKSSPQAIWIPPLDSFLFIVIGPQWYHSTDIIESHLINIGAHYLGSGFSLPPLDQAPSYLDSSPRQLPVHCDWTSMMSFHWHHWESPYKYWSPLPGLRILTSTFRPSTTPNCTLRLRITWLTQIGIACCISNKWYQILQRNFY